MLHGEEGCSLRKGVASLLGVAEGQLLSPPHGTNLGQCCGLSPDPHVNPRPGPLLSDPTAHSDPDLMELSVCRMG